MQIIKNLLATTVVFTCTLGSVALADTSSPDCDPAGQITLLSGSGIRIEVDGKDGGCNAAGDKYSYGDVIGEVRVYSGFPGVTGAQSEGLLFDTPLEFSRIMSPLGGSIFVGRWVTRRGYIVMLTGTRLGATPATGLRVNEFFVYEPGSELLAGEAFFQEWNTVWNTAMPARLTGTVEESTNTALRPAIANAEVSLFRCRSQDGLVGTVDSDIQGRFAFDLEEDGYYQLRVTPPEGFSTPSDPGFPGFQLYANGFTPCRDFRVTPERRGESRTGGLFGLSAETPVVLRLERDE